MTNETMDLLVSIASILAPLTLGICFLLGRRPR